MTDAPETIWAWTFIASKQNEFMTGGWDDKIELETSGKETEYTRTDLYDAAIVRICSLEGMQIFNRASILQREARIAKLEEGLTTISSCVQQWQDHPKKSGTEILLELIKDTCDESLEGERK